MKGVTAAALLLCVLLTSDLHAQAGTPADLQDFWEQFRAAVKANDPEKIASLTAFPFKTEDPLSTAYIREHDRKAFLRIVNDLLDSDPANRVAGDKMRASIERQAQIGSDALNRLAIDGNTEGVAVHGTFIFEKRAGKWAFTRAVYVPPAAVRELQAFWTEFRAAVISNDSNKIASLTAFPFKTFGPDENDAGTDHDRTDFLKILKTLLDSDSGGPEGETMRVAIERKAQITHSDFIHQPRARSDTFHFAGVGQPWLGNFGFAKVAGKWAFTSAGE